MNAISKAVLLTAMFATLLAISCSSDKNDDEGNVMMSSSSSNDISSSSIVSSSSLKASSSSSVLANSSSSVASSSSSRTTPAVCSATRTQNNLKYIPEGTTGIHAKHVLDLTLPSSGNGPFPLVIFLHGGGFSGGSKAEVTGTASDPKTAGPKGYAVASIGYRLSGDAGGKFPGSFNDILTAIRFLRANAEKYCLDPDKFAVTGFSAGGYHAGMVCVLSGAASHDLDGFSTLYPGVSNKVQACVTYAALTDMRYLEDDEKQNPGIKYLMTNHGGTSPEAVFLGINQALKDLPETSGTIRWRANPLNYVTTNTPPLMMIHATDDNVVPWQQSERLVNKVNLVVSGRAEFDKQTSGSHSGFPGRANDIYNFLDKSLK